MYLLGAKGFCTYGCPYGGFFAPLDTLAVGRIRVNDDCEQCGHCTAVCTSNVRVSEEVNTYGMVVDPGCMKCMDCVSVCPNDALSFGFGPPAVRKPATDKPPKQRFDLTWPQEIICALMFAIVFFGTRGVYGPGMIPMLMAAGLAGCSTFVFWKMWRIWRDRDVRFHTFQLTRDGRVRRAGWTFSGVALILAVLCAHSAIVRTMKGLGSYHERSVRLVPAQVFGEHPVSSTSAMQDHARAAIGLYAWGSSIGNGGIGLLAIDQADLDIRRAWLHATLRDMASADAILASAIQRDGPLPALCVWRFQILSSTDPNALLDWSQQMLLEHEAVSSLLDTFVQWCASQGRPDIAIDLCEQRLDVFPDDLHTMRWLSILQVEVGRFAEAIDLTRATLEIDPTSEGAYRNLAAAHEGNGDASSAEQALRDGLVAVDPKRTGQLHRALGQLLRQLGRDDEAQQHIAAAARMRHGGD